jgi:MOSC domain-containing protein YiiM
MVTAEVLSVNVGKIAAASWATPLGVTAIDKRPLTGRVAVGPLGVAGDHQADTRDHGGVDQAVYAFAREDLDLWATRVGRDISNGMFGENLTTLGIDLNEAVIGERWRVGSAVLEVASVRIPCNVFKGWMDVNRVEAAGWVKRFTAEGRPGPYLRVVESGEIGAGDLIDVVDRPGHDVTIGLLFRALTTERGLIARLLVATALPEQIRRDAERYVAQH